MLNHLKTACEPIVSNDAIKINLIDDLDKYYSREVGEHDSETVSFLDKVKKVALSYIDNKRTLESNLARKREMLKALTQNKSIECYEKEELDEMSMDFFHNRNSFNEKRKKFVQKLE